jgi:hypothetical protein
MEEDFSKLDFGDKQYFVNKSLTYDNLALWLKSNIAYIENKGKPFYITCNYENSHYTYEVVKDIKATRSMIVKYKNPNYSEADATSEQYVTGKLGKIIDRLFPEITHKYAKSIPYSPKDRVKNGRDTFNLFTGFKAAYVPSLEINMELVQPWLDHVKNVLAGGDETSYQYVISWLAHIVQFPPNKIGTVLLFKSEQGAGKGVFFDLIIKHIIGRDYSISINDMNQLLGNFNAIVAHKLLTVCDEIQNYGGAHRSNDKLKSLITNETVPIERKGFDTQIEEDSNNYVFLTNNDWPVKVETSDRRYVIIESSSNRIGDREYFNNLLRLTNDEAGTHLYNWLMRFNITIDLRFIPNTKARTQLKMNSVPEPIWLIQVLRGEIANVVCGDLVYAPSILYRSFTDWANNAGYKHNYTERTFLLSINKVIQSKVDRQDGKLLRGYFQPRRDFSCLEGIP